VFDRVVFKIFKVSEKDIIRDMRHLLGLHDVAIRGAYNSGTLTHAVL